MTALSTEHRKAVEDAFVADISRRRDPTPLSRAEIAQVIAATDDEIDAFLNVTLPAALPAPAGQMTAAQLDVLLRLVALKRFEVNHG